MKRTQILAKSLLILLIFIVPSSWVSGNKETGFADAYTSTARNFHSADAIKKILKYSISASTVYANTAEMKKAEAVRMEAAARAARMASYAARQAAYKEECKRVMTSAIGLYDMMALEDSGLSVQAFQYAWLGYHNLVKKGQLHNPDVLTICDFSQSSSEKRMYVIDVRTRKVLYRTWVAHGINSGESFANSFSNEPESCKSSLGFYVTRKTYTGVNGLSLRIDGMDKGFNDNANSRSIVIHGAPYVSMRILKKYGVMGTTFGCPAIPSELTEDIIPLLKNGSCFFIYYPSKRYISNSAVLNSF